MSKIGINVKLRPIKHAFLVRPNDKESFERAVELNSILWGGHYNPIIPCPKRLSKKWADNHSVFKRTSKEIVKGYIDAFDPDFIVPLGDCKKDDFSWINRERIDDKKIDEKTTKMGDVGYGVSFYEVLHDFYDNEFRFVRKHPIKFTGFNPKTDDKLFLGTVFGIPPKGVYSKFKKYWKKELGFQEKELSAKNFLSNIYDHNIRKLLNYSIEQYGGHGWGRGETIYILDAKNTEDLIDFWNLRALGWRVLPIPKQALLTEVAQNTAVKFIERNSGVGKHNDVYYHSSIIASKNVDDEEVKNFCKNLKLEQDEKARGSRYIFSYYPRMWDEWARNKYGGNCCDLEAGSKSHDFSDATSENDVCVNTVDPDFAKRFSEGEGPRFANEVSTSIYSDDDIYAEVIPEAKDKLTRTLSSFSISDWRFSKRAAVYLSSHISWHLYVKIPKAEEVFESWMEDEGYEVKLSAPGRMAKQMIRLLGGKHGVSTLANDGLINLLKRMEGTNSGPEGSWLNKQEFWSCICQIANSGYGHYRDNPEELLEQYIKKRMFQLGIQLKCGTCSRKNWFDIESLTYKVQCKSCFEEFDVPSHSPSDFVWCYKTIGPFSLPRRAEGVLSSLLTLRIFTNLSHSEQTTPMLSYETRIRNTDMEVDLGLFYRENRHSSDEDARLIFAECKSENSFGKGDIDKMATLAEEFPGSVLVFSTLKEDFSKQEKRLLKPLVNRCRRYFKAEKPYNPVLLLTKTELFSLMDIHNTWKDLGGKYEEHGKRHYYSDRLLALCDATQQIYLGMEPWESWVHAQFEKKGKLRKKNPTNK